MRYLLVLLALSCATTESNSFKSIYAERGVVPGSGGAIDLDAAPTVVPTGTSFGGCTFANGDLTCSSISLTAVGAVNLTQTGRIVAAGGNYIINNGATGVWVSTSGWASGPYYNGAGSVGSLIISPTAPTIGSAGTSPSVITANGSISHRVDVGTGGSATGFTLTLPTAATRWFCVCQNVTTPTTVAAIIQTGGSSTTCVMQQRTQSTNAALAFAAGDDVDCIAIPQ